MGLYKLFSCNVEVQYKSYLLSKAMVFTIFTTVLNIILPFIIAYRSRGFWLKSHSYYEQPSLRFTYDYLLVAETEDPSQSIVCGNIANLSDEIDGEENCAVMQVQEVDYNKDGINDMLNLHVNLIIPPSKTIVSVMAILAMDFQLKSVCPLQMQSFAIINRDFSTPPSGWTYYGDMDLYQITHLPCLRNVMDTKYNSSLLDHVKTYNKNFLDFILEKYMSREVITKVKTLYSRSQSGYTGTMDIELSLRIPEVKIRYIPSLLQELKWAWPQYLSLVLVFYWIFNKIKRFVFNNRLLMAWEIVPWRKR